MVNIRLETIKGDQWVEKEITLDVVQDMALNDEALEKNMVELPQKLSYYAELRAELQAQVARRKRRLEEAEAQAAQTIRNTGTKTTESGIKEQVALVQAVQAADESLTQAAMYLSKVEGFYYALRDKATLATALCYKQKEELKFMGNT